MIEAIKRCKDPNVKCDVCDAIPADGMWPVVQMDVEVPSGYEFACGEIFVCIMCFIKAVTSD